MLLRETVRNRGNFAFTCNITSKDSKRQQEAHRFNNFSKYLKLYVTSEMKLRNMNLKTKQKQKPPVHILLKIKKIGSNKTWSTEEEEEVEVAQFYLVIFLFNGVFQIELGVL
jgi:hypothetical protein